MTPTAGLYLPRPGGRPGPCIARQNPYTEPMSHPLTPLPLARELLNRQPGELIRWRRRAGDLELEITDIP